jgi:hypothetical protein
MNHAEDMIVASGIGVMVSTNQSLREKDGGRSQRGLLVLLGSALIWALALWLGFHLF